MAAMAASEPLFPDLDPALSIACSSVSVVRTPNVTGTLLSKATSPDNRPETYHGIIPTAFSQFFCSERRFKGTRHLDQNNLFFRGPMSLKGIHGPFNKSGTDEIVEPARDNCKLKTFSKQLAF
jgi:hypothetical protein